MIRFALPLLLVATAATGAATEQRGASYEQAKLQRALSGLHPGAAKRCVRRDRVTEVRGFRDEILFVGGRGKLWRNRTTGSCGGLARGDIIVTHSFGSDYCAGDVVKTRSPNGGMVTGSCALGDFVPYTR
ncbi:MAG: hypothetical protein KF730_16155 [Sphingomonas sp.]|uniref:hypothetical protein n=1 Tax=Sphingomonas sp. TaxID=28214 RepID=UPI00260076BF|nr:hypothetical protein [Sphingomonas sp.]MBX3566094.1 hypothetical protein [Sphingomonas sp.]